MNLAIGKAATQSSVDSGLPGVTPEENAAGAVDGKIDGAHWTRTATETDPWWQIDLGCNRTIYEMRIYVHIDPKEGNLFSRFQISIGSDCSHLVDVFDYQDLMAIERNANPFVKNTNPVVWQPWGIVWSRFFRITALGRTSLQLKQVMLFGAN